MHNLSYGVTNRINHKHKFQMMNVIIEPTPLYKFLIFFFFVHLAGITQIQQPIKI